MWSNYRDPPHFKKPGPLYYLLALQVILIFTEVLEQLIQMCTFSFVSLFLLECPVSLTAFITCGCLFPHL